MCRDTILPPRLAAPRSPYHNFSRGFHNPPHGYHTSPPSPPLHSQGWERLISHQLASHERTSLITTLFLEENWYEMVTRFSIRGDDAQAFIDVIDEESPHSSCPIENRTINLYSNLPVSLIRCWTALSIHRQFAGSVCSHCTQFVADEPCFQNHCRFCLTTTQRKSHCTAAGLQMCGKGHRRGGKLRSRS